MEDFIADQEPAEEEQENPISRNGRAHVVKNQQAARKVTESELRDEEKSKRAFFAPMLAPAHQHNKSPRDKEVEEKHGIIKQPIGAPKRNRVPDQSQEEGCRRQVPLVFLKKVREELHSKILPF